VLTFAINVAEHHRCDVNGEDIVADGPSERFLKGRLETYASVKKPTPATMQTLKWNHLGEKMGDGW